MRMHLGQFLVLMLLFLLGGFVGAEVFRLSAYSAVAQGGFRFPEGVVALFLVASMLTGGVVNILLLASRLFKHFGFFPLLLPKCGGRECEKRDVLLLIVSREVGQTHLACAHCGRQMIWGPWESLLLLGKNGAPDLRLTLRFPKFCGFWKVEPISSVCLGLPERP